MMEDTGSNENKWVSMYVWYIVRHMRWKGKQNVIMDNTTRNNSWDMS